MGKAMDFIVRLKLIGHQKRELPPEIVRNEILSGYLHSGLHSFLKKAKSREKGDSRP